MGIIAIAVVALMVTTRVLVRRDATAPAAVDAALVSIGVDASSADASSDAGDVARSEPADAEADATTPPWRDPWADIDKDGLVGDAGPAPVRASCADAIRARNAALSTWMAEERARLASKAKSPRAAKVVRMRMTVVRDLITTFWPDGALCATAAGAADRWDVLFTRFVGTTKAHENLPTPDWDLDAEGAETAVRFFTFELRGFADLHHRIGDVDTSIPLTLAGDAAMSFDVPDTGVAGATMTTVHALSAGETTKGSALLAHLEVGNRDLIDHYDHLVRSTKFFVVRGATIAIDDDLAKGIRALSLEDVDRDGLSDLWTPGPYIGKLPTVDTDDAEVIGPPLLAHAHADGSFALDDEVAVAHARRLCPKRPTRLALPFDKENAHAALDLYREAATTRIVCARLWGLSTREVKAGLAPFGRLFEWATIAPPLSLAPSVSPK